ncbi:hypothetical protein BCR39DRAFT_506425 [Naematelia encephala]|uniref:Uncharacterized protein n=1 Tax=Naematelia encephala TaxID=71784 RepID=A0A1Y2AWT2_9TREE|nr:hypothetical protein BCR39DRAFT_506425 [Naematelia encephala]
MPTVLPQRPDIRDPESGITQAGIPTSICKSFCSLFCGRGTRKSTSSSPRSLSATVPPSGPSLGATSSVSPTSPDGDNRGSTVVINGRPVSKLKYLPRLSADRLQPRIPYPPMQDTNTGPADDSCIAFDSMTTDIFEQTRAYCCLVLQYLRYSFCHSNHTARASPLSGLADILIIELVRPGPI